MPTGWCACRWDSLYSPFSHGKNHSWRDCSVHLKILHSYSRSAIHFQGHPSRTITIGHLRRTHSVRAFPAISKWDAMIVTSSGSPEQWETCLSNTCKACWAEGRCRLSSETKSRQISDQREGTVMHTSHHWWQTCSQLHKLSSVIDLLIKHHKHKTCMGTKESLISLSCPVSSPIDHLLLFAGSSQPRILLPSVVSIWPEVICTHDQVFGYHYVNESQHHCS